MSKFTQMLAVYMNSQANAMGEKLAKARKENALSEEDMTKLEADVKAVQDLAAAAKEAPEEVSYEELKKQMLDALGKVENECKADAQEYVENAFRLMAAANVEPVNTKKAVRNFGKLYENQIRLLKTQLGAQCFENAITITPSGSLPVPEMVAMAEPAVKLPAIFDSASELIGNLIGEQKIRGAKLRILKATVSGGDSASVSEGTAKTPSSVAIACTDVSPLKCAIVFEDVTLEQLEYNEWLESVLKTFATRFLGQKIETAVVSVLSSNSTAWNGTSGTENKVNRFYIENAAVALAKQLEASDYVGHKIAYVNKGEWTLALNNQTTYGEPVENQAIRNEITFVPSAAIPAGTIYVADDRYVGKKLFKDVFVERAIAHTHGSDGARSYTNATDFIFDILAYFVVEDSAAVIKGSISSIKAAIEVGDSL